MAGIISIEAADLLKMTGSEGLEICSIHGDRNSIFVEPQTGIQRLNEIGGDTTVYSTLVQNTDKSEGRASPA